MRILDVETSSLAVGEGSSRHRRGVVSTVCVVEDQGSVKRLKLSSVVELNSTYLSVSYSQDIPVKETVDDDGIAPAVVRSWHDLDISADVANSGPGVKSAIVVIDGQ